MAQSIYLFAYGSLSSGMVHFAKVANSVKMQKAAYIFGSAYRLPVGYPAVIRSGTDRIAGELLELSDSATLWAILDQFHGVRPTQPEKGLYLRQTAEAFVSAEESYPSQVYFLNPAKLPRAAVPIPDGNWKNDLSAEPPMTERLSERQLSYIKRLGSSSGREIVPIDLQLYRELMSLEIIVDKGRRLALSHLGQEVYRFLT